MYWVDRSTGEIVSERDKNNVRLCTITVPAKEYDEKIAKLKKGVGNNGKND